MSALPPKADTAVCDGHVRFVPQADIAPTAGSYERLGVSGTRKRDAPIHYENFT
jgi:hypothetical protein